MSPVFVEIVIILVLILANGVFAMAETAFVSSRKSRLQQRANAGDSRARAALELANAPNQFLSTVQLGITLIGILAGAFGGATIADALAVYLRTLPWLAPYSQTVAFALVVACITYLSLVIGELVPKRLALNNPERIAASLVGPMRVLSALAAPFVHMLSLSTDAVLRLLRLRPPAEPPITEEEINVLIEEGRQAGTFEAAEQHMVEHIFHLADRRVSSVMTHRPDIVWVDPDDPVVEMRETIRQSGYSRFPVCRGTLDNVLGVVHVSDLLLQVLDGQQLDVRAAAQEPLYVVESTNSLKVLELFKQTGTQAALVVQEYGEIQGFVTLTDILEVIVGEFASEDEVERLETVQREDGSWLLDGMVPLEEMKAILHLRTFPEEDRGDFETVSGLVMYQLGRIPSAGDHFEWGRYRFEVTEMDGRRVGQVLVTRRPTSTLSTQVQEPHA
jgi:magnesium and cobalt exporter, CNNM family